MRTCVRLSGRAEARNKRGGMAVPVTSSYTVFVCARERDLVTSLSSTFTQHLALKRPAGDTDTGASPTSN